MRLPIQVRMFDSPATPVFRSPATPVFRRRLQTEAPSPHDLCVGGNVKPELTHRAFPHPNRNSSANSVNQHDSRNWVGGNRLSTPNLSQYSRESWKIFVRNTRQLTSITLPVIFIQISAQKSMRKISRPFI